MTFAESPAPSFHDLPGIPGAKLEIRFSDPLCGAHPYAQPIETNSGAMVTGKPENVYCSGDKNYQDSFTWTHSPRAKLIDWIKDPNTHEIFFAFQSISDNGTLGAICEEIKARNIKVTFVISRDRIENEEGMMDPLIDMQKLPIVETAGSQKKFDSVMKKLTNCGLADTAVKPVGLIRGHTGSSEEDSLGWAHNKFFIINPNSADTIHFASGSGNLTNSGVSTNHENWLFFENMPIKNHLVQSTLCMVKNQLDDKAHYSRSAYEKLQNECFSQIPADYPKVAGIESFFVPGEGERAIKERLIPGFSTAKRITLAAHLFGYPELFTRGLACAASKTPAPSCFQTQGWVPPFESTIGNADVRVIADDDIHWIRVGQVNENGKVGFNDPWEAQQVATAEKAGAQVRYMQTAHHDGYVQLHHSKILLLEGSDWAAVWTGAGNFTANAMFSNFENYFYITLPSVVEAYRQHQDKTWNEMATPFANMPKIDTKPSE